MTPTIPDALKLVGNEGPVGGRLQPPYRMDVYIAGEDRSEADCYIDGEHTLGIGRYKWPVV